jgi:hypothetical protein
LKRDDAKNRGRTYSYVTYEHDRPPLARYLPTADDEIKNRLALSAAGPAMKNLDLMAPRQLFSIGLRV